MSVFDLPMTARPGKDAPVGQDELGRTVYRTVTGERYTMPERTEMPAPTMGQRFENLGGLASRAYENLSVQGAIDAAKGIGEGIVSGIVQGFTAPGRALSGEPVSLGDVMATAGMSQVGAAPLRAPAGALRSGATGGGRPPVTFDDVARAMDESIKRGGNFNVARQDASNIFGAGSERVRYTDPESGGTIEVVARPDGSASVLELEVPESSRGQGIGQKLQERVMQDFPEMGGQVSSKAAAKTAYRLGRRPPGKPNATLEEVFADIDDMSSVNMVSPAMQERFAPPAPAPSPSFTLYQGSPHNFAAERLVRYPDGRTEYIVGAPDVLPDVPAGAEVLQDFPLGRQRMDKIGTGTGAQAVGRGVYGSEAEGVARRYRDSLSTRVTVDGNPIVTANKRVGSTGDGNLDDLLSAHNGDLEAAIADQSAYVVQAGSAPYAAGERVTLEKLKALRGRVDSKTAGSMYEMNVNADPSDFLDANLPLKKQPEAVRRALEPVIAGMKDARINEFDRKAILSGKATGGDLYNALKYSASGDGASAATDAIRSTGIPGVRFSDGASGSRNYVVFDENLISIVRKYGIAGAAAMLGVSAVEVEQALAENLPPSQWDKLVNGSQ